VSERKGRVGQNQPTCDWLWILRASSGDGTLREGSAEAHLAIVHDGGIGVANDAEADMVRDFYCPRP
jgi:hypothetical protein